MASAKQKILLLGKIEQVAPTHLQEVETTNANLDDSHDSAHDALAALGDIAELMRPASNSRNDFLDEARDGKFDGVGVIYRTFASVDLTGRFDEEVVQAMPESLKFVCHNGAGYDQVDVHACTRRGIQVSNVPKVVDNATADTNMFLILGALRNFNTSILSLRAGTWRGNPPAQVGHDPQGKILGILGMGGIGRNLKRKAEAFGMIVQYHNRHKLSDDLSGGAKYVDFDELLRTSDVLSCNLPLNFALMKAGAVVVNTARGAVIDEAALVNALAPAHSDQLSNGTVRTDADGHRIGHLFSCGLDVYEHEPAVHPGLVAHPSVLLVPHMGTWTLETLTAMEEWALGNVRAAVCGEGLKSRVPEQEEMEQ